MITISTQALAMSSRLSVMQTQSELAQVQQELSSGTLADAGLSLGGQSGQLVQLGQQQTILAGRQQNNTQAATRLTATTTTLDSLRTSAQSILTTLTSAATAGSSSTATLQSTAASALQSLTSALNTAVGGDYIFGGINSGVQPLASYTPTSASKVAVDTAFQNAFGTSQTDAAAGSISGDAMSDFLDNSFSSLFDASGYSATWSAASDQPMTTTISPNNTIATSVSANDPAMRQLAQAYTMLAEFTGPTMSSAAVSAVVAKATSLVNSAVTSLTASEASIGLSQNAITNANAVMQSQANLLQTQQSDMAGVDTYALTNRLSVLQTQLQASYELTNKLQAMSLTQYLS